jgi:hypothetical protein
MAEPWAKASCNSLFDTRLDAIVKGPLVGGTASQGCQQFLDLRLDQVPDLPEALGRHVLAVGDLPSEPPGEDEWALGFTRPDGREPALCA